MSDCTCDSKVLEDATLQEGDSLPFEIDLFNFCALYRQPNTIYADGDTTRPQVANGFALEALNDGTTGEDMPAYLAKLGQEFRDGSVRWKVIAAGAAGINPATAPEFEVDPTDSGGLDVADLIISNGLLLTGTYIDGIRGESYEVLFRFMVDGIPRAARQTVRVT